MKYVFNKYGQIKTVTSDGGSIPESDPVWTAEKSLYLKIVDADGNYYPLTGNPSNFLDSATANAAYYPLSGNPSNFLTTISGIAAGGDLSGTYANPAILNSAVLAKVLTGLNITGSTISATDSIIDAFGKLQNQLNGVLGGATYQGIYDASTNTPTQIDGTGTQGQYYVVSVSGLQDFGSGTLDLNIGDWIIYNGAIWQKVDNTDAVTSVNGQIGAVNLNSADIGESGNLYWTSARFNTAFAAKSTTDLAEGLNLYYTAARFNAAFTAKSTSDLAEGLNLYYTAARFNSAFAAKSTSDLTEGTNTYFTAARVLATALTGYVSGAGVISSSDTVLEAIQKLNGNIAALTTASVPDSSNKRYVTDAQLVIIGNTSGTNTGDQTTVSGNAGTATALQTARKINSVSFNGTADIMVDPYLIALNAMGSAIVAQNIDGSLQSVISGQSMTSGRVYYMAIILLKAATITGFAWRQITQGNYTSNNFNGGVLQTQVSGTLTTVASSTNDGTIWSAPASGTFNKKAFSTPYVASPGVYFLTFLYCSSAQTTAPSLGILGAASSINTVTDLPNSIKTSGLLSSQTAVPSGQAMSGITAAATEYWGGLYV